MLLLLENTRPRRDGRQRPRSTAALLVLTVRRHDPREGR